MNGFAYAQSHTQYLLNYRNCAVCILLILSFAIRMRMRLYSLFSLHPDANHFWQTDPLNIPGRRHTQPKSIKNIYIIAGGNEMTAVNLYFNFEHCINECAQIILNKNHALYWSKLYKILCHHRNSIIYVSFSKSPEIIANLAHKKLKLCVYFEWSRILFLSFQFQIVQMIKLCMNLKYNHVFIGTL